MGAVFQYTTYSDCSVEGLQRQFHETVEDAIAEYGYGGYTGTFAEADGLVVAGETFEDTETALDWIQNHHEKWEPVLAVKASSGSQTVWIVGGWLSS